MLFDNTHYSCKFLIPQKRIQTKVLRRRYDNGYVVAVISYERAELASTSHEVFRSVPTTHK